MNYKKTKIRELISFGIVCFMLVYIISKVFVIITPGKLFDFNKGSYSLKCGIIHNISDKFKKKPFELLIEPVCFNSGKTSLQIYPNNDIKSISFFLKTKANPNSLEVIINNEIVKPKNYKLSSYEIIEQKEFSKNLDDYYYYFSVDFITPTNMMCLDFFNIKNSFVIKDIVLK